MLRTGVKIFIAGAKESSDRSGAQQQQQQQLESSSSNHSPCLMQHSVVKLNITATPNILKFNIVYLIKYSKDDDCE
jgi:hypothetical protein